MNLFRKKTRLQKFLKKIKKFYKKNEEFIKYTYVSTICTVILYALYFFITWITNGKYIIANFIAYFFSFTVLFFWDQKIFNSRPFRKRDRVMQLLIFFGLRIIGFIIDSSILVLLIEKFKVTNAVSKILSSLITFMFNYITNKLFVFKKNKLL